ncbi:MAG: hypothetical protein J6Q05_02210 [Elusimicrobiaceae bacterium]|nr:hypothetical protein [Elusimicrobiaceae bacterium]
MRTQNQHKIRTTKIPTCFSSGKTLPEIARYIVEAGNTINDGQSGCKRFIAALQQGIRWAGVNWVAKQAGMSRHSLYYAVGRKEADLRFNTVVKLLRVFGISLVFVGKDTSKNFD